MTHTHTLLSPTDNTLVIVCNNIFLFFCVVHGQKKEVHSIFAACDCIILFFIYILYSLPILRSLLLLLFVVVGCRCCLVQQNFKNCSVVFKQGPEVSSTYVNVYVFAT